MSGKNQRPRWHALPGPLRQEIEGVVDGRVVAAQNCPAGYSPGFASRLTLADGRKAFAKAIDARACPLQAQFYRDEAQVAGGLADLADALPTPRLIGSSDGGSYVVLAFECVNGRVPVVPWQPDQLATAAATVGQMSAVLTPSPLTVRADHPRLGGWADLTAANVVSLRASSEWAAQHLGELIALERRGMAAARGSTLVHFDALPHNILMTPTGAVVVDWPHARLAAPFIDVLTVLASAAADGVDPDPVLRAEPLIAAADPGDVDAVLAALAGFCFAGALDEGCPGPIAAAKRHLGRGALGWLLRRLGVTSTASSHRSC